MQNGGGGDDKKTRSIDAVMEVENKCNNHLTMNCQHEKMATVDNKYPVISPAWSDTWRTGGNGTHRRLCG